MIAKFLAFSLVGVIGTLAHYSVLYALVEFRSFDPVWASGLGSLVGMIVNYTLNYSLTFKSRQPHSQTFPKFALIATLGLCLNLALMAGLTHHLYYFYAQLITTAIVLLWNFSANSLWTFQSDIPGNTANAQRLPITQKIYTGFGLLAIIWTTRILTLGLYPLYDPSESRYAEMARKMLETGNWATPLIDYGVPFWGKPPLTIWMTASSLWLGGINDFSARLPSVLLSLGIIWMVFDLANRQRSPDKAWNAVIILASTVLFFVMSGTVTMDVCMSFGITLALASFWLALQEDNPYRAYLFFVGLSIGLMAKGPVVLVLSAIIIGLWTGISGAWFRVWQRLPWIKGTLLMLCISAPWYWLAEQKTPGLLDYFFIAEHWKRFPENGWTGDIYGNDHAHTHGMIWIYWLGAAFPWSLIFLNRLMTDLAKTKSVELLSSNDGWRLYCLLWMVSPLVFFTFSTNIIWTYVLPGLPGFALLLADNMNQSRFRAAFALCVPLSFLALVIAYHLPNIDFFKSQKSIITAYRHASAPNEHLIYFMDTPYSAQFYLQGQASMLTGINALLDRLTDTNHDFYVFRTTDLDLLPEIVKLRLEPFKTQGAFTLFHAKGAEK